MKNPISMHRNLLLSLLEEYRPEDENEKAMWLTTRQFVKETTACFERTHLPGHVTASAWIVSPDRKQVLLMHHAKLGKWFQPGGHCDGDPDVLRVARKEAEEETGVVVHPISESIFDIDVHLIPDHGQIPAHFHYDIRFLLEANPSETLVINNESSALRWILMDEVKNYNDSESMLRMQRKILAST